MRGKTELILAGPGTGKTTTLVDRVTALLRSSQDEGSGIILCTFTRKATEELTQRIYAKLTMQEINRVNFIIGTIHSICFELLSRYSTTDYSDYTILSEGEQIHFIHSRLDGLGFTSHAWSTAEDLAAVFNKINDQEIDTETLDLSNDPELQQACDAYELYRMILDRHRLFDFASIQSTFLHEIRTDVAFKKRIRSDFSFFFVDEYQDINHLQHEIFKELSSPDYTLTVVGDDDQCIYEFRGSDVKLIRNFEKEYSLLGATVSRSILNTNYRSTEPIVSFTNNLLSISAQDNLEKRIKSERVSPAHKPVINYFQTDDEEVSFIIDTIKELKKRRIINSFRDIGILFRSVKYHSIFLLNELKRNGIPFSLTGAGNFFDNPIGEEYMALLNYYLGKDEDDKQTLFDDLAIIDERHFTDLSSLYVENNYAEAIDELVDSKTYSSCLDLTYDVLKTCGFFERYSNEGSNLGTLTELVSSFDEFASEYDPWGLFSFFTYLGKKQDVDYDGCDSGDCIQIMTIHQSKGLEFPVVFIPSYVERQETSGIIDRLNHAAGINLDKDAEEFRVLYVACTRAEELVVITGSKRIAGRNKEYSPKKYVGQYLSTFSDYCVDIDYDLLSNQVFRSRNKVNTDNPILSYNAIALYRMCPRAYMYSHVWNLATKRIGGMEFGQNVHKIIENILRKIMGGTRLEEINVKKEVDASWKAFSTRSFSSDSKFKDAALRQIETFVDNSRPFLLKECIHSSEEVFNISIGETLITGRFDAVFKCDNSYLIVDFKTGDSKDYSGQLSFYSVCFKEKYGAAPVKLAVYYLKSGNYEMIEENSPEIEVGLIKNVAQRIQQHDYQATPGTVCRNCAFNSICPYR